MALERVPGLAGHSWLAPANVGLDATIKDCVLEIDVIADHLPFLMTWLHDEYLDYPERLRRFFSHFGAVGARYHENVLGEDLTNVVYAVTWALLKGAAPSHLYRCHNISSLNSSGNVLEGVMGLCWIIESDVVFDLTYVEFCQWVKQFKDIEIFQDVWHDAYDFLKKVRERNWHQNILTRYMVFLMETMSSLVYYVVFERNPGGIFPYKTKKQCSNEVIKKYAAHFEAIRLGWPSADYAFPGLVMLRTDQKEWVILPRRRIQANSAQRI